VVRTVRTRLTLAAFLDRWESRVRRVGERVGWPQVWLHEFTRYLGDPRMGLEEFWVRYVLLRREVKPWFERIHTEADAREFFTTSEYMLWRNVVHRRHSAWRRVLWTMKGEGHTLLELGCGTAPVSAYCAARRPGWDYWLHDLDGDAKAYGIWRVYAHVVPPRVCTLTTLLMTPGPERPRVVTALDTFEHLADPLALAKECVRLLGPGGYLHWNFAMTDGAGLNLATPALRGTTIDYLNTALTRVWGDPEDHCVSRGSRVNTPWSRHSRTPHAERRGRTTGAMTEYNR